MKTSFCVQNNSCYKLRTNYDMKGLTADDLTAVRHYNDRIIFEMGQHD